jgi:hypothetical protein
MSYSKELIKEFNLPKIDLKGVGAAIEKSAQEPMIQQVQVPVSKTQTPKTEPGVITALGQKIDINPALAAVPPTAAAATQSAIDTAFTKSNLIKAGTAALAGGALLGGGLALGRRIGNIGAKKDKKKLKEAGKKEDLYYKKVDLDPYAPSYTVPQLATTAGGITGTTAGSIYGGRLGSAVGGPIGGFVGAGIGGALGGAAGSIGAYQLAKMARPKKKKKLVQYYR